MADLIFSNVSPGRDRRRICASRTWICAACGAETHALFYFQAQDQAKNDRGCPRQGCDGRLGLAEGRSATDKRELRMFPFTSTHIDGLGTPITIDSYAEMRRAERDYGVVLLPNHEDSPRDLPQHRRGGLDHRDPRAEGYY